MVIYIGNKDCQKVEVIVKEALDFYNIPLSSYEIKKFRCKENPFKFVILKPIKKEEKEEVKKLANKLKTYLKTKGVVNFFVLVY